jgi:alanine-glyoxylate transaminase/serine-glyoxylate transaminase/serine-pyruvate transaminase
MDRSVIDHRSPDFATIIREVLPKLRQVFGTGDGAIAIYPTSGTGAWEAALVNVLRPGDRVLSFDCGHFSARFAEAASRLGFVVDRVSLRWGQEVSPKDVEDRLRSDGPDRYKAVLIVHNETSTGVMSDVGAIRRSMDAAGHDALLIIDAVSSIASVPFKFDEWRVDVALTGSQKGLMLPPGLGVICAGPRAVAVARQGGSPRNFFDWRPVLRDNEAGFFPYTPATLLMFGLRVALQILVDEEGLESVFDRHQRLAAGVRAAVQAWALSALCENPDFASETVTAVVVPDGLDSRDMVRHARERYGLSLGVGLGHLKERVFRIGHLGSLNETEVIGALGTIEMCFCELGMEIEVGAGVQACQRLFLDWPGERASRGSSVGLAGAAT